MLVQGEQTGLEKRKKLEEERKKNLEEKKVIARKLLTKGMLRILLASRGYLSDIQSLKRGVTDIRGRWQ